MSAGVRTRIWGIISDWYILMAWADTGASCGLGLSTLGETPKSIVAHDAMLLVRRALPEDEEHKPMPPAL
jgi:CRISPR-associated protein Cas2